MAGVILATAVEVMARPWKWGEADCCTAASDVFLRLHGIDPMAPLRGSYSTAKGAARIILARGGFVEMAAGMASEAGLRGGIGEPGEVGVAENRRAFGGERSGTYSLVICVAPGVWAGKTEAGLRTVHEVVGCWRCVD